MDSEPKIDLSKIYTWKILESLKLEFGTDEYECVIRLLREFKAEIETGKDAKTEIKRVANIDADYPIRTLDNQVRPNIGVQSDRVFGLPAQIKDDSERVFDDPEKIEPL